MRIAFVTLGFRPFRRSGLDVSGERLVQALVNAGHDVTVLAGSGGPLLEQATTPGLRIVRLPLDRSDWIGYARASL